MALAVLLVLTSVIAQIPHVEGSEGLTLDGKGFGSEIGSQTGGSCALSQTLTTTKKPDVIVGLLVVNDTTTRVTSVTDSESLIWTPRASQAGPANVQVFVYYAIASSILSADNITFILSSGRVATVCQEFGIAGADTNSPFDSNTSMPNGSSDTLTTNSVTYSTNNPNDFLIILQGFCAEGAAGSGTPSGFTTIIGSGSAHVKSSNCASNFLQTNSFYKIVSETQSSNIVSWSFDTQNSPFAVIGDAIESAPGTLSASVTVGSNSVDVGQLTLFSCTGMGGVSPYTYFWTFGDGSSGTGSSPSHTYSDTGTMNVVCTVTDSRGSFTNSQQIVLQVYTDPSITSFTLTPASLDVGQKIAFLVSTNGGNGSLTYSYSNLPTGCSSANSSSFSCTPTSSGTYLVTVTVTDQGQETATATLQVTIAPPRVLGLPRTMGLALIFVAVLGICMVAILSVVFTLHRKKSFRIRPSSDSKSN